MICNAQSATPTRVCPHATLVEPAPRIVRGGAPNPAAPIRRPEVKTIDEMLSLHLLSGEQHAQISAWIADLKTPEAIMQMPAHLWRTLELASVLINFDADVTRAPTFGFD